MLARVLLMVILGLGALYGVWLLALREAQVPVGPRDRSVEVAKESPPEVEMAPPVLARKAVDDQINQLPWSEEAMALEPRDEFYHPVRHVPFLHDMLNTSESNSPCVKGQLAYYGIKWEEIVDGLPGEALKAEARHRSVELREAIEGFVKAAKEFEVLHWRQRFADFHAATESGHYVIIEYEPDSADDARGKQNEAALESLRLGRMNHDFLCINSTSRRKDDQRGPANAIIYVTRSTHPKSLELLDELRRLRTVARDVVWSRLGVAAQPTVPVDGK